MFKFLQRKGGPAPAEKPRAQAAPDPEKTITLQQALPLRARPEVLYRMALVPTRRSAWDSNMVEAAWVGDGETLRPGARMRFRLQRRLGGLRFEAELENLKTSRRGGWRSVGPVGPLEMLEQRWTFEPVQGPQGQGGVTLVTLTVRGVVRYQWVRAQAERLLQQMLMSTLLGMQREVDAPAAHRLEEMGKKAAAEEKASRKRAKGRKGKKAKQ